MKCRGCYSDRTSLLLDLGHSPISNEFLDSHQLQEVEAHYPLKVRVCDLCGMVQIPEVTRKEALFSDNYVYFSSFSSSWLVHAKEYASRMISEYGIMNDDLVLEVASNDGYLLQYFKSSGIKVLGVEPAKSVADVALARGIETISEFFGKDLALRLRAAGVLPKLIVANNVLAHVPDIQDFVQGVSILLNGQGFATFEFPHLSNLIEHNQFDTVYHEHYSYLSIEALKPIFASHNLDIFYVENLNTHGGSLRLFVAPHNSRDIRTKEIQDLESRELKWSPRNSTNAEELRFNAQKTKMDFLSELLTLKKLGKNVAGYGAAAKGNTLLNYCGIGSDLISYIVDRNPAKQGKFLPGSHIPVVPESQLEINPPDVVIIFPWNLKDEIKSQLSAQVGPDVKFMVTMPKVQFI
ncbi:Methyltransferase domain containing protein [Candidatus Nanopelagicaceae bacterium]